MWLLKTSPGPTRTGPSTPGCPPPPGRINVVHSYLAVLRLTSDSAGVVSQPLSVTAVGQTQFPLQAVGGAWGWMSCFSAPRHDVIRLPRAILTPFLGFGQFSWTVCKRLPLPSPGGHPSRPARAPQSARSPRGRGAGPRSLLPHREPEVLRLPAAGRRLQTPAAGRPRGPLMPRFPYMCGGATTALASLGSDN